MSAADTDLVGGTGAGGAAAGHTGAAAAARPGAWADGVLPANVRVGAESLLTGAHAFKRFLSRRDPGLVVGSHSTMDYVQFALGEGGLVTVGDYCYLASVVLLCEAEVRIGNYVAIGWNTTIADTDFHPLDPAERVADAVACSPLGGGRARPPIGAAAVVIEDDVWIGPAATILKGVRIGAGSRVEAGALVTRSVPANSRVAGNPARVVGEVGR